MGHSGPVETIDDDAAYAACASRDTRWDGRVYLGVTSTGVYCRPSCPARMPHPHHCRFFRTAASAATAGFRACRRCRPDTLPGHRAPGAPDGTAQRALTMIAAGVVDVSGVSGLAAGLGISERHLHRILVAELGTTALRLARTRRAQTARMLLEQTDLAVTDVAFAAGFASVRQFNDVVRAELGGSPRELRARAPRDLRPGLGVGVGDERAPHGRAGLTLRLRVRPPFDGPRLAAAIDQHAVAGVEGADAPGAWGTLPTPGGDAAVAVDLPGHAAPDASGTWAADRASVILRADLARLDDLPVVVHRVRRWLDLDAAPLTIGDHLRRDARLAPLVEERPGLRVLGSLDPFRTLVVAILGQQVSLAATRTFAGRLVAELGAPASGAAGEAAGLPGGGGARTGGRTATLLFPDAARLADAGPDAVREAVRIPAARARTVHAAAELVAGGLDLGPGADRDAVRSALLEVPGIGPWTVDMLALRGLADPDALPPGDLVLRRALGRGADTSPRPTEVEARAERWRPWRAYATTHLWTEELER